MLNIQKSEEVVGIAMKTIRIHKVVVNIGVGRSGEFIEKAKTVVQQIVGKQAGSRIAKKTVRDFGIRQGEPIGVMATLREPDASMKLKTLLQTKDNRLPRSSFDDNGSCSFGIREHIEIPGTRYDPGLGIFGLNVSAVLDRPGYRVARRRRTKSSVGKKHRVTGDEAINFFKENFGIEVE